MESLTISNVDDGFYMASHLTKSAIDLDAITVISDKLRDDDNVGMFHFTDFDDVQINDLVLNYSYDMALCEYDITYENDYSDYGPAEFYNYRCPDPLTLLHNSGQIEINDFLIYVDILNQIDASANSSQFWFESVGDDDVGDHGFIENYGILDIDKWRIQNDLGRIMVFNEGTLALNDLRFDFDRDTFDVNGLNAQRWLQSEGTLMCTYVDPLSPSS